MQSNHDFLHHYNKLNPKQKEAVDKIDGPVLVIAGPGSGKTQLLALRVANILKQTDVDPSSILCLTFTDSAAQNMIKRLTYFIGKDAYRVAVHTFHSFATEIINHNPEYFFSGAVYRPADNLAQYKILNDIFDNLDFDNPFKIYSEEHKYTYLSDVQNCISSLKKEGITPDLYLDIINQNADFLENTKVLIHNVFSNKTTSISLEDLKKLSNCVENYIKTSSAESNTSSVQRLADFYQNSISKLIEEVSTSDKKHQSKPITKWKGENTTKNNLTGGIELKDFNNLTKHRAIYGIYLEYQSKLHSEGLFDFDDMLIEVTSAIRKNQGLAYKYQEKYLYTLVDEFQDTNQIQSYLLHLLVDNEYTEGEPNILAVADDDQAIYKFQGANVKNLTDFVARYPKTNIITLTHNYRSHQLILDLSKAVIEQSQVRLSNTLNITKPLISGIEYTNQSKPLLTKYLTREEQIYNVAKKIESLIQSGINPDEIAVITRQHKHLTDIVKIFDQLNIPMRYDRGQNVLDQPLIIQIINILKFISSINTKNSIEADDLLPNILSYEVFDLDPHTIYKLSHVAYKNRLQWLEAMAEVSLYSANNEDSKPEAYKELFDKLEEDKIMDIAKFLLTLAKDSQNHTAEQVLDTILGVSSSEFPDNEMEGEADSGELVEKKYYYFSFKDWLTKEPEYLSYLSGLKVFFSTLRSYKPKETINVTSILEFIDIIQVNKLPLVDNSPYNQSELAVSLLTAHKAKGLEFDHVFIIDVVQSVWAKKGRPGKINLPTNLPYLAQKDDMDDHIRLFFVALTRAKKNLYLSSYSKDQSSKSMQDLEFLIEHDQLYRVEDNDSLDKFASKSDKIDSLKSWVFGELTHRTLSLDQKEWLRPSLDTYKLSVTHLNNFVDVVNGGPQLFLEQNLLRFPRSKSFSAAYGTAMHEAIAQYSRVYKSTGTLPSVVIMIDSFKENLKGHRLTVKQELDGLEKGIIALNEFYSQKSSIFDISNGIEVDFRNQGVKIGDASITGKLDQIWFEENSAVVIDLKTGKPLNNWKSGDEQLMQKSSKYKRQLTFYRLLMENSRDFNKFYVSEGALIFLEPDKKDLNKIKIIETNITDEEVNKMRKLIRAVWKSIINLEFSNIDHYEKSNAGIEQFIEDLISQVD